MFTSKSPPRDLERENDGHIILSSSRERPGSCTHLTVEHAVVGCEEHFDKILITSPPATGSAFCCPAAVFTRDQFGNCVNSLDIDVRVEFIPAGDFYLF